jgi:hypothetical protein
MFNVNSEGNPCLTFPVINTVVWSMNLYLMMVLHTTYAFALLSPLLAQSLSMLSSWIFLGINLYDCACMHAVEQAPNYNNFLIVIILPVM